MSRNSKLISENLREEIAKELGVYEQVKQDGYFCPEKLWMEEASTRLMERQVL